MIKLVTLLFCVLIAVTSATRSYDGYQVIRLAIGNNTEYLRAYEVADKLLFDVWGANVHEGWMDIMIPPTHVNALDSLFEVPHTVKFQNVQDEIDESERSRNNMKRQSNFFANFRTSAAINTWLEEQAATHPATARRLSIGQTYLGKEIYALHLGQDGTGTKPTIVIHCGIHAREWITPTTCCWIIDQMLNQDSKGPELLTKYEWYIIPVLNVDGYDYTHTNDRLWRKNRQPNSGSSCIGTDLNRNYGFRWSGPGSSGNPCSETYYGGSAFSGPETAAVRDLIDKVIGASRVVSFLDIHAYSALWMSPWGYTCTAYPPDYAAMEPAMKVATDAIYDVNGHTYVWGAACQTIYQTSGDSTDWTYGTDGIIHSYSIEAYGTSFTPPTSYIPMIGSELWAGVRDMALSLAV